MHEKTNNLHMRKTKTQISFAVTAKLISAFAFATRILQFLFYLYPQFQISSLFLCLSSSVCVRHGRKPKLLVFSCTGSHHNHFAESTFISGHQVNSNLHVIIFNEISRIKHNSSGWNTSFSGIPFGFINLLYV